MPLVQHNDMIKELSADTADDALDIGILPRTSWGNQHLFSAHVPHLLTESVTVDPIAVAQEILRCLVPGERLHHLLCRPLRRRVFRDIHVHDAASVVGEDHEDKEHLVRHGGHEKKVHGDHILDMVVEKGPPRG